MDYLVLSMDFQKKKKKKERKTQRRKRWVELSDCQKNVRSIYIAFQVIKSLSW